MSGDVMVAIDRGRRRLLFGGTTWYSHVVMQACYSAFHLPFWLFPDPSPMCDDRLRIAFFSPPSTVYLGDLSLFVQRRRVLAGNHTVRADAVVNLTWKNDNDVIPW